MGQAPGSLPSASRWRLRKWPRPLDASSVARRRSRSSARARHRAGRRSSTPNCRMHFLLDHRRRDEQPRARLTERRQQRAVVQFGDDARPQATADRNTDRACDAGSCRWSAPGTAPRRAIVESSCGAARRAWRCRTPSPASRRARWLNALTLIAGAIGVSAITRSRSCVARSVSNRSAAPSRQTICTGCGSRIAGSSRR